MHGKGIEDPGALMKAVEASEENATSAHDPTSVYAGRHAVLATMHGKESVIAPVMLEKLGLIVSIAPGIDTDTFGTFTGEIPRAGTIREAAIRKARLGMDATGLQIGLASEGSYGPHPHFPFIPGGVEIMVLVDNLNNIVVSETLIEDAPVFGNVFASTDDELASFLERVDFPHHALIVKSADPPTPSRAIYKGLRDREEVSEAMVRCAARSRDGRALVQTDMRAHMNPTRMSTLQRLAARLADRLLQACPACRMPGFGQTDVEVGLPCEDCGAPSLLVRHHIFQCVACSYLEKRPRPDGRDYADPGQCPQCNP
ncbi:DUF6671 family protein [Oryzifoliimicrobium ureilyticus]|uniref:DUF6671 family protein n=1 Tax=Oryzifoliimicrobium ureilyticus TaxID=3113724 RepID=UPI0030767E24